MATVDTFTLVGTHYKIVKDPLAVLDYSFDWTAWLASVSPVDTIASVVFSVDSTSGIAINSSTNTAQIATAWVRGGTVGQTGTLTCRITTVGGRTDERSVQLSIKLK